jgi:hypothetical protein
VLKTSLKLFYVFHKNAHLMVFVMGSIIPTSMLLGFECDSNCDSDSDCDAETRSKSESSS